MKNFFYDVTSAILSDQVINFGIVPADRVSSEEDDDKDYFDLSGNIDARKIKSIASSYGFSSDVGVAVKAESTLLLVKRMRNKLAHGRMTFAESVKDKSVQDMIRYKDQVVQYMECVLSNISTYLDSNEFQESTVSPN